MTLNVKLFGPLPHPQGVIPNAHAQMQNFLPLEDLFFLSGKHRFLVH